MVGTRRTKEVVHESDSDGEAPEQVSLSAGREDAQKLRKEEKGNQRRIQAEAKQRRRRNNLEKSGLLLSQESETVKDAQLPDPSMASSSHQDEDSQFSEPPRSSGFLDASIVDLLSAREKTIINSSPPSQVDDSSKENGVRKRKKTRSVEATPSGIKTVLLDGNRPTVANVTGALDFKRRHLFGRRVHRSFDTLPKS